MANTVFMGYIINEDLDHPHIEVGDYTYYAGSFHGSGRFEECVKYSDPNNPDEDKLKIGKFCSIGSGANFIMFGNQGHRPDWTSTYTFYFSDVFKNGKLGLISKGDTIIGNDVFIGMEAVIMPGVKIGDGAIIGTRAVVSKDVEPYSIVVGNPAKEVKKRFDDETIKTLLEIKWWNWPKDTIDANMNLICDKPDIDKLKKLGEKI